MAPTLGYSYKQNLLSKINHPLHPFIIRCQNFASFVQASAEYRFPVISFLSGALFFDAATDFGTANSITGNPGGVRGKPGSGYGYGVGVRIQSPLGPIRLDYGVNNEGDNRIQFGFGEKF